MSVTFYIFMCSITIFRYKYIVQTFTKLHSIHTAIRQYNLQFETAIIYNRVKFQEKIPIFQDINDNSRTNYRFSRTRMNPPACLLLNVFSTTTDQSSFIRTQRYTINAVLRCHYLRSRRLCRRETPPKTRPPVLRSSTRRLETISWAGARPSRLSCFVSCFRRYLFQIGPGAGERENNLCHQTDRN